MTTAAYAPLGFVAALAWATLSLSVRRRHPGVGAVGGSLVILLAIVAFGFPLMRVIVKLPGFEDDISLADVGMGGLLLTIVFVMGAGVGWWQGARLRMPSSIAALGGVFELVPWALVCTANFAPVGLDRSDAFEQIHDRNTGLYVLTGFWIVAELAAPFVVARLPKGPRYPRTFDVPPEP